MTDSISSARPPIRVESFPPVNRDENGRINVDSHRVHKRWNGGLVEYYWMKPETKKAIDTLAVGAWLRYTESELCEDGSSRVITITISNPVK